MLYNKKYGTPPRCFNGPFVFLHCLKHDYNVLKLRFNNVRHWLTCCNFWQQSMLNLSVLVTTFLSADNLYKQFGKIRPSVSPFDINRQASWCQTVILDRNGFFYRIRFLKSYRRKLFSCQSTICYKEYILIILKHCNTFHNLTDMIQIIPCS